MKTMFLRKSFLLAVLGAAASLFAFAQLPSSSTAAGHASSAVKNWTNDPAIERRVESLLKQMTLDEKVGQLNQYSIGAATGPGTGRSDYEVMLRAGQIGSLLNVTKAQDADRYQKIAVEHSRLHIPVLFGYDVIHGYRTIFPVPLALSATWDPQIVEMTARVAAREASASGIRWAFSPMVDIARDARWGRITESAGEDPYLGAEMARAYVHGYQGASLDLPDSIASCTKHFVGYGAAEGGRDYNTTEISEHTLRQFYLPPFQATVDAGGATFMSAFNSLNGIPASANPFTLTQVLRKEWGFRGFVVSDWGAIGETIQHGTGTNGPTAARKSFLAGVDMDMESNLYHQHLAELVKSGKVPQAALDEAVRRVLRVKFALGLFEHPYVDESKEAGAMLRSDSIALARTAAEASFVLLKNGSVEPARANSKGEAAATRSLLPLSAHNSTIAVIGPLADSANDMLGSWDAQGRPENVVTLLTSLKQQLGSENVKYVKGTDIMGTSDAGFAEAVNAAQQADTTILALGEDAGWMSGEASSRAHLGLPGNQEALLERVVATGKPVVLVIFSGRPLTLPWAFEHTPAVLQAWFPGVQAGPALSRILFGEDAPAGRLSLSWPRSVGQEPLYYNALNTGRPAAGRADLTRPPKTPDEKYMSRYIDEQNSPQFPFGYGLTYTTFKFGEPKVSATKLSAKSLTATLRSDEGSPSPKDATGVLTATVDVTNTGSRPGDAVAEMYIRLQGTSIALPVRSLEGFQRVTLNAGETKTITFKVPATAFAFWNDQNKYGIEPAHVSLWISEDSASGTAAMLDISE